MPEQLGPADRILNIWLCEGDLTPEQVKEEIASIRAEVRETEPEGSYISVIKEAWRKLYLHREHEREIQGLTPEDFND